MRYSTKLTYTVPTIFGILGLLAIAPVAFAQDGGTTLDASAAVGVSAGAQGGVRASATGTAKMNANATSTSRGSVATTTGTTMRAENQSGVAAQVEILLRVADRSGGIGPEIRAVAREYASTSVRVEEAKTEVESRPGWLTFLFGTDYGNLGQLRSEITTTNNQIQRLRNASDRTFDASVKADLAAQIETLETQASTTAEFIAENEGKFSLFGWLFRIFQ